ncbi:MAG TPA: SHOCT domain-containing protein [Ktedonobacteraceae bacterium]|nr:SHOCT domain-containing protein [Ktedonobacteraceae bacterium]
MMWGYGFGWFSMTLMMLGSTIWIALLIVLTWALIRWLNNRTAKPLQPGGGPTAMEILRQRYARGEIDTATFEHTRERLEATVPAPQDHRPFTEVR